MNKYKIKSIVFSALWGMAILNSSAGSCSKEKKITDLTDQELSQKTIECSKECIRRRGHESGLSEKEIEDQIKNLEKA